MARVYKGKDYEGKAFAFEFPSEAHERLYAAIARNLTVPELLDVARHGADAGWSGFSYYQDTTAFYGRHKADIWELLAQAGEEQGERNLFRILAGFREAETAQDVDTFENLMAWFALEEVARHVLDGYETTRG